MANRLTPFNPFSDISRFEPFHGLEGLLRNMNMRPLADWEGESPIKIDVSESDDKYTVKADIPGVRKEDIKVAVDGNQVSISAEVQSESEEKKGEAVVRRERYYGQQYRRFALAHDIDDSKAVARYQNGVLELELPKKSGGKENRQIQIQ